jgi:hypothetical protein
MGWHLQEALWATFGQERGYMVPRSIFDCATAFYQQPIQYRFIPTEFFAPKRLGGQGDHLDGYFDVADADVFQGDNDQPLPKPLFVGSVEMMGSTTRAS